MNNKQTKYNYIAIKDIDNKKICGVIKTTDSVKFITALLDSLKAKRPDDWDLDFLLSGLIESELDFKYMNIDYEYYI